LHGLRRSLYATRKKYRADMPHLAQRRRIFFHLI
jgi:hypothetical protein